MPSDTDPTIRFATEDDVPTILALIHELAAYEKASSSVHATEATLLATLSFPSSPHPGYARTLLIFPPASSTTTTTTAAADPTPPPPPECAGMALYYPSYSTWRASPGIYLEDLFVRPPHRGRGYGKLLLATLARLVRVEMRGERLEWSVLRWNEPSLRFYDGLGARRMEGWVGMRVDDLGGEGGGEVGGKEQGALERLAAGGKRVVWGE